MEKADSILWSAADYSFQWDLLKDSAQVRGGEGIVWEGPLLPALWLKKHGCDAEFVKAKLGGLIQWEDESCGSIPLEFDEFALGSIQFRCEAGGFFWESWSLVWDEHPQPLIAIYLGAMPLSDKSSQIVPTLDKPFWPGWRANGFCIPSGRVGPLQSFFRCWDHGHSRIALGNFAPAMGTPYGAAFPRPLMAAGLGGPNGWTVMGAPDAPDGAMSLVTQSGCSCFELLFREDIWGALPARQRVWNQPFKLIWAKEAIDAFGRFYYPEAVETEAAPEQHSLWNTWGDFREGIFDLPQMTEYTQLSGAKLLVYDDLWETMNSSAVPDYNRFPDFDKEIASALESDLKIGFWQSVGWIDRPEEVGLSKDDLLCGIDGEPRLCSWLFDPFDEGVRHFALDPSSSKARQFLKERTQRLIKALPVSLLKLDFYYGLPGPDVAVPRDPALRGERMGFALVEIIAEAAREVRPDITILGYSLHPHIRKHCNLLALDDLGDAAGQEAAGHAQWSFWSVIAGRGGQAINASSGYDWAAERDVLLNTAVVGAPGGIMPLRLQDGPQVTSARFRLRRALAKWYRKTRGWRPLWLNSILGGIKQEPELRCWGRLEKHLGEEILTALALRSNAKVSCNISEWPHLDWEGDWALIAQDDKSIFETSCLACIPICGSKLIFDCKAKPSRIVDVVESANGDIERVSVRCHWSGGKLVIELGADDLEKGLLGCLVYR